MAVPDDSKGLPKSCVLHLIYLNFAFVSAECSLFIDLLGARLTPDAVSQSSIQSDCAYCHWFSVGCTHDQYLHMLWKSEFSARWELILLSPRLREGGGGRVGRGEGQVQRGTAHFNGSLSTK